MLWISRHHHSLHSLIASVIAALAFALAAAEMENGIAAILSFHVHPFKDVLGSRGRDG